MHLGLRLHLVLVCDGRELHLYSNRLVALPSVMPSLPSLRCVGVWTCGCVGVGVWEFDCVLVLPGVALVWRPVWRMCAGVRT